MCMHQGASQLCRPSARLRSCERGPAVISYQFQQEALLEVTLIRCWMRSRRTSSMSRNILLRLLEMFWLISSSCKCEKFCTRTWHQHGSTKPTCIQVWEMGATDDFWNFHSQFCDHGDPITKFTRKRCNFGALPNGSTEHALEFHGKSPRFLDRLPCNMKATDNKVPCSRCTTLESDCRTPICTDATAHV